MDAFITEFGSGIPTFITFRDALSKLLEFLHRRLQQPHVLKRICFHNDGNIFLPTRIVPSLTNPKTHQVPQVLLMMKMQAPAQGSTDNPPCVGPMSDPPLAEDPETWF